ncbi:hypothetical protein, partial [Nocardia sp. NPDC003345]
CSSAGVAEGGSACSVIALRLPVVAGVLGIRSDARPVGGAAMRFTVDLWAHDVLLPHASGIVDGIESVSARRGPIGLCARVFGSYGPVGRPVRHRARQDSRRIRALRPPNR